MLDGVRVEARVSDGPGSLPELMREAQDAGVRVTTAQVHRPTLDDVFLNLTGRSLRETEGNGENTDDATTDTQEAAA